MKKNLIRLGGVAAIAAGMAIAQTPAPAPQPPAQSAAPAQPGMAHHVARHQFRQRMMNDLNLTPQQREQSKAIFQQARQTAQPFREQLRQNRQAMALAVKSDEPAKIHQLALERGRLVGQMMAIRSEAAAKFYANLTPAQRAKADQIHQRMEHRWQQRTGERTNS